MAAVSLFVPFRRCFRWALCRFDALPVKNGNLALLFIFLAVALSGTESVYVQVITTQRDFSPKLFESGSFLFLLCLDYLVPLTLAFLSRRTLFAYFAGQTFLSATLLHYTIFFYNPLTLSTIYHSMHGAASLGVDILGFARWDIIFEMGVLFCIKALLLQLGRTPDWSMPRFWGLRGILAVTCMAIIWVISNTIYGQTGLSLLWVDSRGHRTATERRLETGTREAVRSIGYLATWIGEWMSGTYRDTALIYAEMRCADPDEAFCRDTPPEQRAGANRPVWNGIPVPEPGNTVVLMQVESLDFASLGMRVNDRPVLPFLDALTKRSVTLRTFAPHKVGSCNSDYEILNGRVADQNVLYYTYIKEYPDSIIHTLERRGYATTMFHGLDGKLFNLREAYTAQGFSRLVFKEELCEAGYQPSSYIMKHVMDEHVLEAAGKAVNKEERQAQFIVTMSTHIPFIGAAPEFKSAGGTFARYVSSLNYFDMHFARYYETLPEGTLLILWGDHGSDVDYPPRYPRNGRQVPFIVHVKDGKSGLPAWTGNFEDVGKIPADGHIYTLCELAHYLRRVFMDNPLR